MKIIFSSYLRSIGRKSILQCHVPLCMTLCVIKPIICLLFILLVPSAPASSSISKHQTLRQTPVPRSVQDKILQKAAPQLLENTALSTALVGIAIYDLDAKKYIYQHQNDKNFTPASNMKLFTCYAAMKYLGDSVATFKYIIKNDSSVFIQPLADPTFLHPSFHTQPGYFFLKKYKSIDLYQYDDTLVPRWSPGWAWDDYMEDYSAQQNMLPLYGNMVTLSKINDDIRVRPPYFKQYVFVKQRLPNGFSVAKPWDSNIFNITPGKTEIKQIPFTPDTATVLKLLSNVLGIPVQFSSSFFDDAQASTLYTQSTDKMLQQMMHESDNFLAEQSLLMIGIKQWNQVRTQDIIDTLWQTDFKNLNLPHKLKWVDGSGLSRYNLCTPQNFVQLLCAIKNKFPWSRISSILPTGNQGTLKGYYEKYIGSIYAKTGTLSNNISLSGYLITKRGRRLVFSIFVDHHTASSDLVRKRIERFITQVIDSY